ncbi:MAG TPA: hypothetical protein V6C57_13140 [Coleofasciculaceae cyanobacterium]
MNPIQYEVAEFWETLSAPETGIVFKQAIAKIWKLLKQIGKLAFLLLLLLAVVVVFLWSVAFQSGRAFRNVVEDQQPAHEQILNGIVKLLLLPVQKLAEWTKVQAKQQFGIDLKIPLLGKEFQQPLFPEPAANTPQLTGTDAAEPIAPVKG